MKKIFLLVFLAAPMLLGNCKSGPKTENETKNNDSMETTSTTTGKVVHLTTEAFRQKVYDFKTNKDWKFEGSRPCIVDFYADWCGPCKMVAPILEDLAKEYDGKVDIYKVNTDQEQELAQAFGISSIPTIIFVPVSGQPQAAMGALPKETFKKAIASVLKVN